MSVKTKMTAIADKLRAMLGTTNPLSLDGIASALDTQKTQTDSAFSAVAEMGGTVPVTQRLSTLPSAIRTIPTGVTVQKKSGTFRTNNGSAAVNCGFSPDALQITISGYPGIFAVFEGTNEIEAYSANNAAQQYPLMVMGIAKNTTGFSVGYAQRVEWTWTPAAHNATFNYTAIKYT